jgi:cytochrome c-type biogenesis protein CcmH
VNHTRRVLVPVLAVVIGWACSAPPSGGPASSPAPASQPQSGATGSTPALPPGHPPIAGGGGAAPPASASTRVTGTVRLAPGLGAGPGDVLYVIAKKNGTTLAVQRIERPAFPLDFDLSSADAMVAGTALAGPVDVVARLSRSGDAIPSPGDLEGTAKGVEIPSSGVQLTIDTTRK